MSTKYKVTDITQAYFITITTVGWIDVFTRLNQKYVIIDALRYCQKNKGLEIYTYCLMHSHLHLLSKGVAELFGRQIIPNHQGYPGMSDELIAQARAIADDPTDVAIIAQNLGLPEDIIAEVKHHYWVKQHLINTENGLFKARFMKDKYDIELWEMAKENFSGISPLSKKERKISEFKNLIAHEYVESQLMKKGLGYTSMTGPNLAKVFDFGGHDIAPTFNLSSINI